MVQRSPSLAAGGDPTGAGAEPVVSPVLVPSPWGHTDANPTGQLSGGAAGTSKGPFLVGAAHTIQIPQILLNIFLFALQKQEKSPDSRKFFPGEKGALPESMNPCRDFTFAIDFMREMLRYSDSI